MCKLRFISRTLIIFVFSIFLSLCVTHISFANTITVNTSIDTDVNTGLCSLRTAIYAANVDAQVDGCPSGNGADIIIVPAGIYTLTVPNVPCGDEDGALTGDLDITGTLTLIGAGRDQTVILGNVDNVFDILPSSQVTITNLTAQAGAPFMSCGINKGGGIQNDGHLWLEAVSLVRNGSANTGGGILNNGQLDMTATFVISNSVYGTGGGIYNNGWLRMEASTVAGNESTHQKYEGYGGGIINRGTMIIQKSTIANNTAEEFVGGIANLGNLLIEQSEIVSNSVKTWAFGASCCDTHGSAAGISNSGLLTLTNSNLSYNVIVGRPWQPLTFCSGAGLINVATAIISETLISHNRPVEQCTEGSQGGGLYNAGVLTLTASTVYSNENMTGAGILQTQGEAYLTNVTLSTNHAMTDGGGIAVGGGIVTMTNVTIADNQAITGAGILANSPVNLRNVILANQGDNCANAGSNIISSSHNLSSDASCTAPLNQLGDLNNTDPKLEPLAYNDPGTTPTYALLTGSPAIDAGDNQDAPAVDQRGWSRPEGEAVDIGAYEYSGVLHTLFLPLIVQ